MVYFEGRDVELIIICAIIGCIPAAIASSKGRSFFAWWAYGALLFVVALIHSLVIKKDVRALENSQLNEGMVKCPFCAEVIKPEAIKCKHCGSDVEAKPIKDKLIDITGFVVTSNFNGNLQVDDFKVKALAEKIKAHAGDGSVSNLITDYLPQLDKINKTLPDDIKGDFRERIGYWLS